MRASKIYIFLLFLCIISGLQAQVDCEVVEYKTDIVLKDGLLTETTSVLIQINNKNADWVTDIEIPYRSYMDIDIIEGLIYNAKGKIVRKLKKKDIISARDYSAKSFYDDFMHKKFSLRWNEFPYSIKYTYETSNPKFIDIVHWYPVIYSSVPVLDASLSVELPMDYKVRVNTEGALIQKRDTLKKGIRMQWFSGMVFPPVKENFAPLRTELVASVRIVPLHFFYSIAGCSESWQEIGLWHFNLNKGADLLTESEKKKVNSLIQGETDKKEIARKLYHYLQDNTHYINIALDIGGLKPYPASYVCEKKYGDCKALSMYMKALLKKAGIESHYTLVQAGDNHEPINRAFPSQQFNHVILCVPLEEDTIWLENTANHLPFNYLGSFTQDRLALIVDQKNSRLIHTPTLTKEDVLEMNISHCTITPKNEGHFIIKRKLQGDVFEKYRHYYFSETEEMQKKAIEADILQKNSTLLKHDIIIGARDDKQITVELELIEANTLREIGGIQLLYLPQSVDYQLKTPKQRKNELRINYPVYQIDSLYYSVADLDKMSVEFPQNISIDSEFGHYKETYNKTNTQLIIYREFLIKKTNTAKSGYADFYAFIESVLKAQKKSIIIITP